MTAPSAPNPDPWLRWFSAIGLLESASFVGLLGIAMPLKYGLDIPSATTYVGWVHGMLFLAYGLALLAIADRYDLGFKRVLLGGFMACLPLGPVWIERRWQRDGLFERVVDG